jgi:glucosamine--fructose-6-phosphate aminotransferase (isomerizing)
MLVIFATSSIDRVHKLLRSVLCQLVAYVGSRPLAPLMLEALEIQEPYYGALGTGLGAVHEGKITVLKASGNVAKVKKKIGEIAKLEGSAGLGHSRYSSLAREDPRMNTDKMVHPFTSDDQKLALMHNGIINNFQEHWDKLKTKHTFTSYEPDVDYIVDSEVAVHMLSEYLADEKEVGEALAHCSTNSRILPIRCNKC